MYVRLLNHLVMYARLLSMYVGWLRYLRFGLINEIRLIWNYGLDTVGVSAGCDETGG